ncbi:MAG: sulfurtransferase TusA [Hahellaceae bacterium]|nr:sulfurtransferase TusA [Hahellaceae bacterium]
MGNTYDEEMDLSGLICPEPVMMLHAKVREVPDGYVIRVIATDPATTRDIPRFCQFLGHDLLTQEEEGGVYRYSFRVARPS